jgi:hypothetical protein
VPRLPTKEIVLQYLRPLLGDAGEEVPRLGHDWDWFPEFFFPSRIVTVWQAYDNRKVLESDRFADTLIQWIESVWSIGPHEVRRPFAYFPPRVSEVDLNGFMALTAAARLALDKLEVSLVNRTRVLRFVPEAQAEIRSLPTKINVSSSSLIVDFGHGLGIAQPRGHEVIVLDKDITTHSLGNEPIADIAGSDGILVIAMRNAVVHVLRDGVISTFFTYLCSVSSVEVGIGYDAIIVANQEGIILICSIMKESVQSSFEIADRHPLVVKLTHAWGISVILSVDNYGLTYWISSYSQEGELLNEFQIRQQPSTLNVFTSGSGFDYITYADEKNAVYTVDAIGGKRDTAIDLKKRLLVAVTVNGVVTTINAAFE